MNFEEIKQQIKITVAEVIPNCEIILFGSWARGENNFDSDIDLLLVTEGEFEGREKIRLCSIIHKLLLKKIEIPFDVLMNSKTEIDAKKEVPGHVIKSAIQEGFRL